MVMDHGRAGPGSDRRLPDDQSTTEGVSQRLHFHRDGVRRRRRRLEAGDEVIAGGVGLLVGAIGDLPGSDQRAPLAGVTTEVITSCCTTGCAGSSSSGSGRGSRSGIAGRACASISGRAAGGRRCGTGAGGGGGRGGGAAGAGRSGSGYRTAPGGGVGHEDPRRLVSDVVLGNPDQPAGTRSVAAGDGGLPGECLGARKLGEIFGGRSDCRGQNALQVGRLHPGEAGDENDSGAGKVATGRGGDAALRAEHGVDRAGGQREVPAHRGAGRAEDRDGSEQDEQREQSGAHRRTEGARGHALRGRRRWSGSRRCIRRWCRGIRLGGGERNLGLGRHGGC